MKPVETASVSESVELQDDSKDIRNISLVIPMCNEEEVLLPLFKRLLSVTWRLRRRWAIELVIVNDGSTDRTGQLLELYFHNFPGVAVKILHHEMNKGIGAAMATAFIAAQGDVVCTMDADCTYSPEQIESMIDFLESEEADIVTASPYHPAAARAKAKAARLLLSKAASSFYGFLAPKHLYCYTSFFRVYRRSWSKTSLFESDGFLAVTEILLNALSAGARVREYPIQLSTRVFGESKMHFIKSISNHLRLMSKMISLRLRPRRGLSGKTA